MVGLLATGCGSSTSTPSAEVAPASLSPSAASSSVSVEVAATELPSAGSLPAGRYTRSSFRPPITLELDDGWSVGQALGGFFDVQQQKGTPDVIAVQFAHVEGVIGAGGATVDVTSAASAANALRDNPGLTVLEESVSRMSGLYGSNVVVENAGSTHAGVLQVPVGTLGIDPDRRLWVSFFDTADGVIAIMVGGSVAQWQHTLDVAEPVFESVEIG